MKLAILFILLALPSFGSAFLFELKINPNVEERYDLLRLQWDNRPVWWIAGRWQNDNPSQNTESTQLVQGYPSGDVLDFSIGETTEFGQRPLNYTAQILDESSQRSLYFEHGFLSVKNATKLEPNIYPNARIAFLTTSDRGWTVLEEGIVENKRTVRLNMTRILKPSFQDGESLSVEMMEREFTRRGEKLYQTIRSRQVDADASSSTIIYSRIYGWDCVRGCNYMVQYKKLPDACMICL